MSLAIRVARRYLDKVAAYMAPGKYYTVQGGSDLTHWFYPLEKLKNGSWKGYMVSWDLTRAVPAKAVSKTVDPYWEQRWREATESSLDPKVRSKFQAVL